MNFNYFTENLLRWYPLNRRDLPWRETRNPYIIWLSEIILQQTRVAQGLPYFHAFINKFPSVQALAKAPEEEILRTWQGLGYYSRARNLHACAKSIIHEKNGKFPDNYKDLLELKGVGPYTAAAIASFAYKEQIAVVDGNVYRVLSRFFGLDVDISSHQGKKPLANWPMKSSLKIPLMSTTKPLWNLAHFNVFPKTPTVSNVPCTQDAMPYKTDW